MRTYNELFKVRGVAVVVWSQLLARFAFGMQTITFAIHLEHIYHNYTVAGLAIGAATLGCRSNSKSCHCVVVVDVLKVDSKSDGLHAESESG